MAMKVEELLRPLTYDDLEAYDDERYRYEIVAGRLVVSSAPLLSHGQIVLAIYDAFRAVIRTGDLGRMWAVPAEVELNRHNVVQPDLFFIARERLAIAKQRVFGSPDLVVEVVSSASRRRDYIVKRVIYAAAGIKEYWIVNPSERTVDVLALVDDYYVKTENEGGVARSAVVPGVEIDLERLFANLIR